MLSGKMRFRHVARQAVVGVRLLLLEGMMWRKRSYFSCPSFERREENAVHALDAVCYLFLQPAKTQFYEDF